MKSLQQYQLGQLNNPKYFSFIELTLTLKLFFQVSINLSNFPKYIPINYFFRLCLWSKLAFFYLSPTYFRNIELDISNWQKNLKIRYFSWTSPSKSKRVTSFRIGRMQYKQTGAELYQAHAQLKPATNCCEQDMDKSWEKWTSHVNKSSSD